MRMDTKNLSNLASIVDVASHSMLGVLLLRREGERATPQGQTNWPPREGNPCPPSPCCCGIAHMASIQRCDMPEVIVLTPRQMDGGE